MEIISLKSEDTGKAELKITDIKQAVKNPNRANVFVNNEYSFSLDIAQLVDEKLKIGTVLTAEKLNELKDKSEYGKLYQRTLEWVLTRPHSIKETKDYLFKKEVRSERNISRFRDEILERLISKGHLDDKRFAEYYVENRFVSKGISKKRMRMELMKKGIKSEIIDEVLNSSARNDEAEIKKIIAKKRNKYDDEKLINYLVRQGFGFELARTLVQDPDSYGTD
jgi:regulatory protein